MNSMMSVIQANIASTVDEASCSSSTSFSSLSSSSTSKRSPNWTVKEIEALIQFIKENDQRTILLNQGEIPKGINATKKRYWQTAAGFVNQASSNNRCWRQVRKKYKDYSYIAKSSMKAESERQEDNNCSDKLEANFVLKQNLQSTSDECYQDDSKSNESSKLSFEEREKDGDGYMLFCRNTQADSDKFIKNNEDQSCVVLDSDEDESEEIMPHKKRAKIMSPQNMKKKLENKNKRKIYSHAWNSQSKDQNRKMKNKLNTAQYYQDRIRLERQKLFVCHKVLLSVQDMARSLNKLAGTVDSISSFEKSSHYLEGLHTLKLPEWSTECESSDQEYFHQ